MTDQYAVMGYPVSHSKSPRIHAGFALQTGQSLTYEALAVEPGQFAQRVKAFFEGGGKGLNITVPFKQEAFALAEQLSPEAEIAAAVNTLLVDAEGRLQGHNTDGIGLVRDILHNHQGELERKSILVLGAGGATRGILLPLLQQNPSRIHIANRTVTKAEELVSQMSGYGALRAGGFDSLEGQAFDWIINATSASLQGELPPLPPGLVQPHSWCYDLMYGSDLTIFGRWASEQGAAKVLDGLGMLVEQAAESFFLWRGVRPDTAPMIAALKDLK